MKSTFVKRVSDGYILLATPGLLARPDMVPCDSRGREFRDHSVWEWNSADDASARIGELLDQGFSQAEVARQLGVNKSTVSRHAAKRGAQ